MFRILSIAAALAAVTVSSALGDDAIAGYDKLSFKPAHRAETVSASVWYPVGRKTYRGLIGDNPVFIGTPAYVGAAVKPGRYPLVVISHGSGGNMDNLGWLSSALAESGALVLGLNHPGSTSGDSSPRRSIRVDERARDLSSAIDMILADPVFGPLVDRDRITALGFSLGGATVLEAAGARFDRKAYRDYCQRLGEAAMDCVFFARGGVDLGNMPAEVEDDVRDPRLASVVAVDPGFTYAFTAKSTDAIDMPSLLINLGGDDRMIPADLTEKGSGLIDRIKGAEYKVFQPANHFTFLGLCKPQARAILADEGEDPICDEPAGTDRTAIHAAIIESVRTFLKL